MTEKKFCCPFCKSTYIISLCGDGGVLKYGRNVMLDISPETWICNNCKEIFHISDISEFEEGEI